MPVQVCTVGQRVTVLEVKGLKSTFLGSRYRGAIEWDSEVKTHSDQNLGTKEGTPLHMSEGAGQARY